MRPRVCPSVACIRLVALPLRPSFTPSAQSGSHAPSASPSPHLLSAISTHTAIPPLLVVAHTSHRSSSRGTAQLSTHLALCTAPSPLDDLKRSSSSRRFVSDGLQPAGAGSRAARLHPRCLCCTTPSTPPLLPAAPSRLPASRRRQKVLILSMDPTSSLWQGTYNGGCHSAT
jgi:hypothetical protein